MINSVFDNFGWVLLRSTRYMNTVVLIMLELTSALVPTFGVELDLNPNVKMVSDAIIDLLLGDMYLPCSRYFILGVRGCYFLATCICPHPRCLFIGGRECVEIPH